MRRDVPGRSSWLARFRPSESALVLGSLAAVAIAGLFLGFDRRVVAGLVAASVVLSPLYWRWHYRSRRLEWEHRTRAEIFQQAVASASRRYALERQRADVFQNGDGPPETRTLLMLTDLTVWGYGLVDYMVQAQRHLTESRWAPPYPVPTLPARSPEIAVVEQAVSETVQWLAEFCDPARRARFYGTLPARARRDRWIEDAAAHARQIWRACEAASLRHRANQTPT
jgi:hypothetical protein